MKKLIYSLAFVGIIASCKSRTEAAAEVALQDSLRRVAIADSIAKVETEKKQAAERAATAQAAQSGSYSSAGSNSAKAPEKPQGLSKAAKGAIIGGVAGAATGAIINKKNRAAGAVVGGAAGAGVGYTIGRAGDRKSGRVEQGRTYRQYKRETSQ
ncbi:YMGG-like glycine zipper-containing protein [Terrimonas pollutisoli]|uniref:YMGG-like glycine zipper-containing protein n=1 Tax=Terrimonas pollutisoli TaxID=3034147 RepID=UPI0023EB8906|nr:YMGG-like glycine zipper-containing protein [Terrimonas sp. H1YJ31]